MTPGLYWWTQPSGAGGVLRIGWLRRVAGDEWEALHLVVPMRHGDVRTMPEEMCHTGPPKGWTYTKPLPRPSPVLRYAVQGPESLDPAQWESVCPRPLDWEDSGD